MEQTEAEREWGQFVSVGPGLVMKRATTVRAELNGYDVQVVVGPLDGRLVAREVIVCQLPGGPPVTGEALRSIPIGRLTRTAWKSVMSVEERNGVTAVSTMVLTSEVAEQLRRNGPTVATLKWVAHLYRLARLLGDPPTKTVETSLGVPRSTAGRWIAAARSEGLLGASEGAGKAAG